MKESFRKLRLTIGKWLLDKKIYNTQKPETNPKILVLQQDGKIGDYIVSSFIFRELRKCYPNARLDVVCSKNNIDLFKNNEFINHFYLIDRKRLYSYFKVGKSLSANSYDYVINLPVLLRNRDLLLTRLINAKFNIGYQKQDYQLFNLSINDENLHFSQIYQKAIELVNQNQKSENNKCIIDNRYIIPFNTENTEIEYFIEKNQLKNFIVINFFGAASSRKFSIENIRHIVQYLAGNYSDKQFLFLTFPAVNSMLTEIIKPFANCFIYEQTQSISDSIALMRYADTIVSPDTSIVHIASGLNKKIIAFYKKTDKLNFKHWHPNSDNATIIFFENNVNEIKFENIVF